MRSSCNLLLFSRAFCRFFSISARLRTGPDEDEEEEEEEEEEEDDDNDDDDDANEEEAEEGLTMGALLALMQVEQRQLCVARGIGAAKRDDEEDEEEDEVAEPPPLPPARLRRSSSSRKRMTSGAALTQRGRKLCTRSLLRPVALDSAV